MTTTPSQRAFPVTAEGSQTPMLESAVETCCREHTFLRPRPRALSLLDVAEVLQQVAVMTLDAKDELGFQDLESKENSFFGMPPLHTPEQGFSRECGGEIGCWQLSPRRKQKRDLHHPQEGHPQTPLSSRLNTVAKRSRSNSFLVHNAPRLPASPDLPDFSGSDDEGEAKFPPPICSPVFLQPLVNNNLPVFLPDPTGDAVMYEASSAELPSPPPLPLMTTPSPTVSRRVLRMRKADSSHHVTFAP